MKNNKIVLILITIIISVLFVACSNDEIDNLDNNSITNEKPNNNTDNTDNYDNSDEMSGVSIGKSNPIYTIADIKAEFEENSLTTSSYAFKPFYNMSQTTEFTFHFNCDEIDPIKAISVHTDPNCEVESSIYQTNIGYKTEDGVDVIVRPPSSSSLVLSSEDRLDYKESASGWGYAPIYYICVKYNLDSEKLEKLDEPIVIPFTIKQEVSTPNAYAKIDENGNFLIKWDAIPDAVSYRIYKTSWKSSRDKSKTASSYAYVGEYITLLTSLDANCTEFSGDAPYVNSYGNIHNQNSDWGTRVCYVTAVDANGNESFFSKPICSFHYDKVLPYTVKNIDLGINDKYYIEEFLDRVDVTSIDKKTLVKYPINYKRVGKPSEYSHKCEYEYNIPGTLLSGRVTYYNANDEFPEEYSSSYNLQRLPMPKIPTDNVIPTNIDVFVDGDYSNSVIDVTSSTTYPDDARIKYDSANLYIRADIEAARMINGGVYYSNKPDEVIDSYLATERPEYIVIKENGTIIVRKSTPEDFEEKEIEIVKKEEETTEPAQNINNNNFVEEQRKSTKKQVTKADSDVVEGTNYPVFADTAGQKYLAYKLINQEEKISLKAFPNYQNADELFDDLLYVWYQNPYIMGIDPNECTYDYNNQILNVKYNVNKEDAKKLQNEVWKKANEVISNIISNSMTDEEKILAIWNYIENNSSYNMDAFDYAMNGESDFYDVFANSWNTYGILCEEVGVCQSYSYAFKALTHLCGIESVMVTGTMNNGGHAWNAVKLDDRWYMIDLTNNSSSLGGIDYWVCNASTNFISQNGFVLDDGFVNGTDVSEFINIDDTKDWYYVNEHMPSDIKGCAEIWKKEKDNKDVVLIKYQLTTLEEKKAFWNNFKAEAQKIGVKNEELAGWKLFEYSGILLFKKQ